MNTYSSLKDNELRSGNLIGNLRSNKKQSNSLEFQILI